MTRQPLNDIINFWNKAATGDDRYFKAPITFSDPINLPQLEKFIDRNATILDFGCGYGRITNTLYQAGYQNVKGIDVSPKMRARAYSTFPHLQEKLFLYDGKKLPFDDDSFDAITSFTVLNAIPADHDLSHLMCEFKRILKRPAYFYLYEFMIAPFDRDVKRYEAYHVSHPDAPYGVFQHDSGIVMRHFSRDYIEETLLSDFKICWHESFEFKSMNGNECLHNQWIAEF